MSTVGAKTRPDWNARPSSLAQAEEWADRCWPGRGAPLAAWLEFHQRRAALYTAAAQVDPGHRHEAGCLASFEREEAKKISRALAAGDEQPPIEGTRSALFEGEDEDR